MIVPKTSRGCAPWVPPVFVGPGLAAELERSSIARTETSVVFEPPSRGRAAGGALSGVKVGDGSWTKYGAKYVSGSRNSKIGAVDATWASIESTCVDCTWKTTRVCYALGGRAQFVVNRLDEEARRARRSSADTSFDEADVIDAAYHTGEPCETGAVPSGTILRVHASGDTSTLEGARALAGAIARWKRRGGALAYSYTHAWRRVPRSAFGELSVLASIDRAEDVPLALARGYGSVTVIVTEESWARNFSLRPDGDLVFKQFQVPETKTGLSFIPCPAQYPVDSRNNREASRWKAIYLGRKLGLIEPLRPGEGVAARRRRQAAIEKVFSTFVAKEYVCGPESLTHLPEVREKLPVFSRKQVALQQELADQLKAVGLPAPGSEAFLRLLRRVEPGEKSTCQACGLCFDDQALGRKKQAIAFRPDFSGGIVKTEALLRKRDAQAVIAQATK